MNFFDYALLIIFGFIIFQSAAKGFIDELISIISLIISTIIAHTLGSFLEPLILQMMDTNKIVSLILSYGILFLICLAVSQKIFKMIFSKAKINIGVDMLLGVVFGAIKSLVLLLIIVYAINFVVSPANQPIILKESVMKQLGDKIINIIS